MTNILYIDTSGQFSLIMLFNPEKILAVKTTTQLNQHAQNINVHIQEILDETKISWQDIHAIAVMNGPGSYTGLRIGLASAKGFCYAHDIPLILVNKFELLHFENLLADNSGYIFKARENEYFFQAFSNERNAIEDASIKSKEEVTSFKEKNSLTLFTSDENTLKEFDKMVFLTLNYKTIQLACISHYAGKKFANLMISEPFYVKNVHINKINKL